ncbi:hypothetical protein [Roseisolibacter sp. H3M3-2]|uniref:hypothetical protein n=1 Tax=Roseisolibacter sp. H3M3-2 TaxID=3031323 RepID=UPI0023DA49F4|nr:hypothetical protein [Roseisolibacter sp. H3M3-2]MDF1503953.1 hypothetical protein [Roseisolibacter sp. H3M3-2]
MPHDFLPWDTPDAGRYVRRAFRLHRALAALDAGAPGGELRAATLRYLEVVRAQGYGHRTALRLLLIAAAHWAPSALDAEAQDRLGERLRFWVGTVYGLRWRAAGAAAPIAPRRPA